MTGILGRIDAEEEALRRSKAEVDDQVRERTAQLEGALEQVAVYSQVQQRSSRNVSHECALR